MNSARLIMACAVVVLFAIGAFALVSHGASSPKKITQTPPGTLRYLPLGDSYTIGQSDPIEQRWPNQLVQRLSKDGVSLQIVDNPSVTGYTSQNLIDRELPKVTSLHPDVVSVLIGVNDYVQGVPLSVFEQNLDYILNTLQKQVAQPTNIFLVTIPDYAKTPTGARFGNATEATAAIEQFNTVIRQAGSKRGLAVADIFAISQKVAVDPSLTAGDGLHPSGKQYALWTNQIYETLKSTPLLQHSSPALSAQ